MVYFTERATRSKSHKLTDIPKELDDKLASFCPKSHAEGLAEKFECSVSFKDK